MKICAIYNVWGDWDLLEHSINNVRPMVDGVIVVFSRLSNYGEHHPEPMDLDTRFEGVKFIHADPAPGRAAMQSETAKRNCGLTYARRLGFTHFIMMDSDEFYEPAEFQADKDRFEADPDLAGLVGKVKCYFKRPTMTIGYDVTLVPMIHKITPVLKFEFNREYPFAWTEIDGVAVTPKKKIRIDPTRSMNINAGVKWTSTTMHHYSWIRSDVMKKIRNSTAKQNLEGSTIVADYCDGESGKYCQFYKSEIVSCDNLFNIPDIIDHGLISLHRAKKGETDKPC